MNEVILDIYSTKHIGTPQYAGSFFSLLEKYDILPDKIGLYEPLRKPYVRDEAIKLWTSAISVLPDVVAGGMLGKKKRLEVSFDVSWAFSKRATANSLTIWFTINSFKQKRYVIDELFKEVIRIFEPFHGYITDFSQQMAQHVTGTIEYRMDGIFWCNYYSETFVDFFGKETLLTAPWYKTELIGEKRIIAYATKEPDDRQILESDELINKIKKHLGKDSFGDVEKWLESGHGITQIKDMPKIDFSEIRRPVSDYQKL